MNAGTTRDIILPNTACNIPVGASAYSINITVVPTAALGYLSIWQSGQTQTTVSTLNSDGRVKANAAIVPAGANGGVSIYVSHQTHVIIDINGYFKPGRTGYYYHPITPCRIIDTRSLNGTFGGPFIASNQTRTVPVLSSPCSGITNPTAYSLNMAAVPREPIGFVATWPTGQSQVGLVSTLNAPTGSVAANAAIVPAGTGGSIDVFSSNNTDLVIDVNGYFSTDPTNGLVLYTMTPCRVLDTRVSPLTPLSGTSVVPVTPTACGAEALSAKAFVLNATVVPKQSLGFLSLYPNGVSWPNVSTLNAGDPAITSNMALTSTTDGSVNVLASNSTDLILDLTSYFSDDVQPAIALPSAFPLASANNVSITNNLRVIGFTIDDSAIAAQSLAVINNLPFPATANQMFVDTGVKFGPQIVVAKVWVPTAAERVGNYTDFGATIYDPLTGIPGDSSHPGSAFVGNIIPPSRLGQTWFFKILTVAPPL